MGRRLTMLLILAVVAMAQTDPNQTSGSSNGRLWNQMNRTGKLSYVAGYLDGVAAALERVILPAKEVEQQFRFLVPKSTYGDTVDFLGHVLQDPRKQAVAYCYWD